MLDKMVDMLGYLIMTEDGAVLSSGGDLENNEAKANIFTGLINLTEKFVIVCF